MAKYAFKVYLSSGSQTVITLSDMENTDLFDMDRYVAKNGWYFGLIDKLVADYGFLANQTGEEKGRTSLDSEFGLRHTKNMRRIGTILWKLTNTKSI